MKKTLTDIRRAMGRKRWSAMAEPKEAPLPDPSPDTRDYDDPFAMPWQPRTAGGLVLKQERERQKNQRMSDLVRGLPAVDPIQPIIDRMYEWMGQPVMWRNGDYFAVVHPNWWKRPGTRLRWDHTLARWFIVETP